MARRVSYERSAALEEAVRTFWSHGFSATSMRLMVDETGVGTKGLYAEFGSKAELFVEAVQRYVQENEAYYADALEREPLGLQNILSHFGAYRFDEGFRGCLLVNSLGEFSEIPPEAAALIEAFFERVRVRFEANLTAAQAGGSLPDRSDPQGLAASLVTFDMGLAVAGKSAALRPHLERSVRALLGALPGNRQKANRGKRNVRPK